MRTFDGTIDRMSVAGNDDSSPTSWSIMLKGRSDVMTMRAYHLVDRRHVGLSREGDVIRFAEREDGTIVGFANITLLRRKMPTASIEDVAAMARSFLQPPEPMSIKAKIVVNMVMLAIMGLMFWGMTSTKDDIHETFARMDAEATVRQNKEDARKRVELARDVVVRCGTLAGQARVLLKDGRIDGDELEVLDTRLRQVRAEEGIAACPVRAPLDRPAR